jgi:hypothetical protein
MKFNEPTLFGKNKDGYYLGKIKQIGTSKKEDLLVVSNRKVNTWIFSLFTDPRQLGLYIVKRPHKFKEGQEVIVELSNDVAIDVIIDNKDNHQKERF